MSDLRDLLAVAEAAAAEAGAALLANRRAWSVIEAEIGREVKIGADTRAEALILEAISKASSYPIISEEAGWVRAQERGDRFVWAIDPLDGSVNYLRDYPHCAVSIALLDGGAPVLGVVDCFVIVSALPGPWAKALGSMAKRCAFPTLQTLPAAFCKPACRRAPVQNRCACLKSASTTWRKVRMIGSAASALAYVAAGRAEAYRESGSMIWDVAAGCALVKAAGGDYRIEGAALDQPLEVAAGNGRAPLPR